jgi:O-antigen ligase
VVVLNPLRAFTVAALAGLVPLVITPGVLFHYDITPRIVVVTIVAAVGLVRSGAFAKQLGALWNRQSGRWLCMLAGAQIVWFAVCTALSTRPWFSLLGTNWRRLGLLTMLAVVICTVLVAGEICLNPGAGAIVLRAASVAAILTSLYGIAQYFDIDPWQSVSGYHAQAGDSVIVRPPGTMGQADYFGWWLAVALFCAYGLARAEHDRWRWVGRAGCVLSGIAILFTGTRSAMLAVLAGFGFVYARSGIEFRRAYVVAGFTLTVSLAGFYFSPAGTRMRARVEWSASEPLGGARPLLWRDSLRMVAQRPIAGFGPETFAAEFPRYQSTDLARLLPAFYQESPHNAALDALTSEGAPGLVLALGWIALGLYAACSSSVFNHALVAALIASAVAAMFSAVTVGPLVATSLVIAMLIAGTPKDNKPGRKVRPAMLFALVAPVALCLFAYASMLAVSDFALARFQRQNGAAAYLRVVQTALPGAGEDLYCSRLLSQHCNGNPACSASAMSAAARATETADSPSNAWYNLAIFEATRNEPAPVEKALRKSVALAPHWFKPHWALASLLALTGRPNEARAEAEQAVFLDAGKDSEVVQTVRVLTGTSQKPDR